MSVLETLKTGDVCSFQIYPTGIIEGDFTQVVFRDKISFNSLSYFNQDGWGLHAKVFATLPEGTPNNPTLYDWYSFQDAADAGKLLIIGAPWIKEQTLTINDSKVFTIQVLDGDSNLIKYATEALNSVGYRNLVFTQQEK